MPQIVHVAVDGDSRSVTPRPGHGGDRFLRHLAELSPAGTRLHRGLVSTIQAETTVLIGSKIDPGRLRTLPQLHTIIVPWAGIPRSLIDDVAASGRAVEIRNIHHNAPSAAETAVGLLLAVARGIPSLDADLRRHDWRQRYLPRPSIRLEGAKAVVLGRGAIGRRIARALSGLGMVVEGLGRPTDGGRWCPAALARHVEAAMALMVAIPAGPETDAVIDATVLDAMPGGIVVNVGRGSVIDEAALYERLEDRRLFGAGLDVWWRTPRREDEHGSTAPGTRPFHELGNLVMTPHVGGGLGEPDIEEARARAIAGIIEQLDQGASGDG